MWRNAMVDQSMRGKVYSNNEGQNVLIFSTCAVRRVLTVPAKLCDNVLISNILKTHVLSLYVLWSQY